MDPRAVGGPGASDLNVSDLRVAPAHISATVGDVVLSQVADACRVIVGIVGCPDSHHELSNAAAVPLDGRVLRLYRKCLHAYGVFDEGRQHSSFTSRVFGTGRRFPITTRSRKVTG
jgi:hypothetical protein